MAMRTKQQNFEVKTAKFQEMTRELSRAANAQLREVIDHEVGRVLTAAMQRTIGGTPGQRKESVRKIEFTNRRQKWVKRGNSPSYNLNPAPITRGYKGKVRAKPGTGIFYPAAVWQRILALNEQRIAGKIAAVGTAAAQWLAVADKLGVKIEGRGLARTIARGRQLVKPQNAAGARKNVGAGRYSYRIWQGSVLRRWAKMGAALQSGINGRLGFFQRNFRSGVFRAADTVARKYPGLRVRGSDSRQVAA